MTDSPPETHVIPSDLAQRPLLNGAQLDGLVDLFSTLSNDSRLRILHVLARSGELGVSDIADELDMSTQAVSNQLQRMADRRLVARRRDGNRIYYRIIDHCVGELMEFALCLLGDNE